MAKTVKIAELVITTTDGGTFKLFGQKAKKARGEVEKLGGASQATDRRIKGVGQQSANASKNFSKQAQTMQGGVVAVYATIAAQMFAVSAAFMFMKSAMETRNLIEGQKAFGSVTGVAYQTLTLRIQEATNGMLGFKEAASAGAIGIAAGLSTTQLAKLGTAATNASLALGRDLTDSFNRLIRGVTKAEPELLDELGIILRLENATNKYAVSVGKTREQLNAYERTQAVLNDVLDQAATKYGMIQAKMGTDAFAMGQFSKAMDDLVISFQRIVIEGLIPFLKFFKDNSLALVAAVALFVMPIIKSLLPNLNKSFKDSARTMKASFKLMERSGRQAGDALSDVRGAFTGAGGLTGVESEEYLKGKGVKTKKKGVSGAVLTKAQIAAYRRGEEKKLGIWKNMRRKERALFRQHLSTQEAMLKGSTLKRVNIVLAGQKLWKAGQKSVTAMYLASLTIMKGATAAAAWAMNKAMMAAGVIGMIAMIIQGIISLMAWYKDLDETAKKLRVETERIIDANKTLKEELERMVSVKTEDYLLDLKGAIEQTGAALQSTDIAAKMREYNKELVKGTKDSKEAIEGLMGVAEEIGILAPELSGMYDLMAKGTIISQDQIVKFQNLAAGYIGAGQAAKMFTANQEALNKALDKEIKKFTKLPFQELLTASNAFTGGIREQLGRTQGFEADESGRMVGTGVWTQNQFGMEQAIKDREVANATRLEELVAQAGQTVAFSGSSSAKFATRARSMYDSEGEILSPAAFQASMREKGDTKLGGSQSDWAMEEDPGFFQMGHWDALMQMYNKEAARIEEINKIRQESIDDLEMLVHLKEVLRQQVSVESLITKLQKDSIDYSKEDIRNRTKSASLAVGELTLKNRELMIDEKVAALRVKEAKMDLDVQTVTLAFRSKEQAAIGALKAYKEDEKLKYTEAEVMAAHSADLADRLEGKQGNRIRNMITINNLSITALDAAEKALTNATGEAAILAFINALTETKLQVQKDLLNFKDKETDLLREQKKLLQDISQLEITRKRDLRISDDWITTYVAQRDARIADIGGTAGTEYGGEKGKGQLQKQADLLLETQLGRGAITEKDAITGVTTALDRTGLKEGEFFGGAKSALSVGQQAYNELLQKELDIKNAIAVLEGKQQVLVDEEKGLTLEGKVNKELQMMEMAREHVYSINPASKKYMEWKLEAERTGADFVEKDMKAKAIALTNLELEADLQRGIADTLSNAFQSMFQSLIDGTKSFKDSMKDLAKSVLADLAAMFLKAAALKFMLAMFPGMGGGTFMSALGGDKTRYGGIQTGYAGGGIARGPNSGYQATLHGTEAVVPLGNDRSIPVQLSGAQSNTVNVAVNISGQNSNVSATGGGDAQALGRSIGGLVQQHLQQEMRPGGLLNRQGSGGRGG